MGYLFTVFLFYGSMGAIAAVVMAGACIRAIWLCVFREWRGVKVASCPRCRYPVEGIAKFVCPECGSDYRVAGIITPVLEARFRGNLLVGVLAWLFLVFLATGLLYTERVIADGPVHSRYCSGKAASGSFSTIEAWINEAADDELHVMLRFGGTPERPLFEVDSRNDQFLLTDRGRRLVAHKYGYGFEAITSSFVPRG